MNKVKILILFAWYTKTAKIDIDKATFGTRSKRLKIKIHPRKEQIQNLIKINSLYLHEENNSNLNERNGLKSDQGEFVLNGAVVRWTY